MYIITKHNRESRQVGYVRQQGEYWKAAKFSSYRAAMHVVKELNATGELCYNVDLAIDHDCSGLFADERNIHA